jgi:hypothetical protein
VKLFKRLHRRLARERPPLLPTRVYVKTVPEHSGVTLPNKDSTRYRIHICNELEENEACESLVHEWAHVVRGTFCKNVHDALYWIEHGRCWAVWESIIDSQQQKPRED